MARFIVLRVEDNAVADQLVEEFRQDTRSKVFGLFALPTVFCDCDSDNSSRAAGGKRITRGGRLGWFVHRGCGRANRGSWQSPRNLLEPDWSPAAPEFMFLPKLTWTHALNAPEARANADATNDATTRSE